MAALAHNAAGEARMKQLLDDITWHTLAGARATHSLFTLRMRFRYAEGSRRGPAWPMPQRPPSAAA